MIDQNGKQTLDRAFDELEQEAPGLLKRAIRWIRSPKSRWVRLPLGVLFIAASFVWFLPVVGIEFLPIGLLLVAQDIPFLRGPTGRLVLWLLRLWRRVRDWFKHRRNKRKDSPASSL